MSESSGTLKENLEKYFKDQIQNNGYSISDKNSVMNLRKKAMEALKLKKGNFSYTKDAIEKVMEELNLKQPDEVIAESVKGLDVKLIKQEVLVPEQPQPQPNQIPQPNQMQQTPEQQKLFVPKSTKIGDIGFDQSLFDTEVTRQTRIWNQIFGKVIYVYAKTGLIEVEDVKPDEELKTLKDYQSEVEIFSKDLATACVEEGYELPKVLKWVGIALSGATVFGSPLLNLFVFGKGKKPKTETLGRKDNLRKSENATEKKSEGGESNHDES